ncbi:YfbM family protein [Saccharibacillus sp. JS10]|uniref:YfbM family protein n=1 Tax=Saccharibacillus sp. JS10 TaxID=2950552 RepID=UPI00210A785C|nr:YfbM family protein [Saccharibacillus sp. JS10]MCQ4088608.1 YfbM family protein [Saccharibacillus sp. JS10]
MGMIGYLQQVSPELLNALIQGERDIHEYLFDQEKGEELDLDKAWHGLHYLLCGDAFQGELPLFNALMGGRPINEHETEDIIVRYLTVEEVAEVSNALTQIGQAELKQAFEPDQMNEAGVYPSSDWNEDGELDYLLAYYEPLKTYYQQAAVKGEGMLLYVS